jgi:hypothetical protein
MFVSNNLTTRLLWTSYKKGKFLLLQQQILVTRRLPKNDKFKTFDNAHQQLHEAL